MEILNASNIVEKAKEGKVQIVDFGPLPETKLVYRQFGATTVEISTTIPYEQMLTMIQWSIAFIMDERTFISAPLHQIIRDIALLKFYTNIDCSEIEIEGFSAAQVYEWYDIIKHFEIPNGVRDMIDKDQYVFFIETLDATLNSIVAYRNSAAGIVDRLSEQNDRNKGEITNALDLLKDDENAALIERLMSVMHKDGVQAGVETPAK